MFATKDSNQVSWYQPHLGMSLQMIGRTGIGPQSAIIDIGGGDSTLVDDLLQRGFRNVTVLDIASPAIERARRRLGSAAGSATWKEEDVLQASLPEQYYDLWHDRAVFHFFVDEESRRQYLAKASAALKPDGHMIIATFADDGPERCSGLPTMRYSERDLAALFAEHFTLVESAREAHTTPQGKEQRFLYCRLKRKQ